MGLTIIAEGSPQDPNNQNSKYAQHSGGTVQTVILPDNWLKVVGGYKPATACMQLFRFLEQANPSDTRVAEFVLAHEIAHAYLEVSRPIFVSFYPVAKFVYDHPYGNPLVIRNLNRAYGSFPAFQEELFADVIAAYLFTPSLLNSVMWEWIYQNPDMVTEKSGVCHALPAISETPQCH